MSVYVFTPANWTLSFHAITGPLAWTNRLQEGSTWWSTQPESSQTHTQHQDERITVFLQSDCNSLWTFKGLNFRNIASFRHNEYESVHSNSFMSVGHYIFLKKIFLYIYINELQLDLFECVYKLVQISSHFFCIFGFLDTFTGNWQH